MFIVTLSKNFCKQKRFCEAYLMCFLSIDHYFYTDQHFMEKYLVCKQESMCVFL